MFTITIKNIFKISADKTVYVSKFNFEFTPRPGMVIKINNIECKINAVAEKTFPNPDKLVSNKNKYQWDIILDIKSVEEFECNVAYPLEIPGVKIFKN